MSTFPTKPGAQMKVDVPCPACGQQGLDYSTSLLEVPYFKEVVSTQIICDKCHYKHNDVFIVTEREPQQYVYNIKDQDDLNIRVIRSTSGTMEIPELGIKVEPAGMSEAFITNIEGILNRMEDAVNIAINSAEDQASKDKGKEILEHIKQIKFGEKPATFILQDPMGNSTIIAPDDRKDRLTQRPLTEEERKKLSTGVTII
jgi:zinc finger protein